MKRAVLSFLACVAVAVTGACSNVDNVTAPGAAAGQPRFEGGGMAGSGGRGTTPPADSITSASGTSLAGDDEGALNGGMAGSGG